MNGITIYVEGGGDQSGTKREFRKGMDAFLSELKSAARAKSWHWKLVPGGGRQRTYDAFCNACRNEDNTVIVLLVDSEGPVPRYTTPVGFLRNSDGWELSGIDEEVVHLMVQTMETWIVSDPDALSRYYGRDLRHRVLPSVQKNLENISKRDIEKSLTHATNLTRKGTYHKIKHGTALLEEIDSQKVRNRCPSCDRFFDKIRGIITRG
ncbi:MAG: DUF4276 family protein [Caldilineaceae bacterium]|nr:DUF4276 family protein [Caldilineaceae bacterium]